MRILLSALPFLLCPPLLRATEVAKDATKMEPGVSSAGLFQAMLALVFIVGLLFALAYVARKFLGGKAFGQGERLKLLGGLALGPRERIVLVEAGDDLLVVGIVPGQIRTLHRMKKSDADVTAADAPAVPLPPLAQSFAQILQKFSRSRSHVQ